MDDQKYYGVVRDIDQLKLHHELLSKQVKGVEDRQNKHEEKVEAIFERLADGFTGIDKKLDIFITQQDTKSKSIDKILKWFLPITLAIAGGVWTIYNNLIDSKISHPTPTTQPQNNQH